MVAILPSCEQTLPLEDKTFDLRNQLASPKLCLQASSSSSSSLRSAIWAQEKGEQEATVDTQDTQDQPVSGGANGSDAG